MHTEDKIRLLVLTDISSNRTGFKEPDDTQSLVRLLLYANHFDIEGLIATYTPHWNDAKPEYLFEVIEAYGKVREQLALHDSRFPTEQELRSVVKMGNPQDGWDQVGKDKDTEASEWIISRVDAKDERSLWINVWGGTTDLAQALWKVKHTRSKVETDRFVAKLRIYSISDQYGIGSRIRELFPDLFYIIPKMVYRGMYKGGDRNLTTWDWVERHIRQGHGPLGEAYPNYDGGDLWDKVVGLKEGDSPSFLYLIPNGLGDPEKPELGCWGGRFIAIANNPKHYSDAADSTHGEGVPGEWITVSRWRGAYQASFAARMDWCNLPPEQANREPVARVAGESVRCASPGDVLVLDAGGSMDPRGGRLFYRWFVYQEAGTYSGELGMEGDDSPQIHVSIPKAREVGTVHIILEVTNDGTPALTSYRRIILQIKESCGGR
jgi:hypothetical protein